MKSFRLKEWSLFGEITYLSPRRYRKKQLRSKTSSGKWEAMERSVKVFQCIGLERGKKDRVVDYKKGGKTRDQRILRGATTSLQPITPIMDLGVQHPILREARAFCYIKKSILATT